MSHFIFAPATAAPAAGADIAAQTALTLARLDERLRAERSSLAGAVVINVYLRRASDLPAMNDAYRQAWKGVPPTRTTVVTDLDEEAAKGAMAECRAAFGAKTSMTPVKVALAAAGARVEIMTMAERG